MSVLTWLCMIKNKHKLLDVKDPTVCARRKIILEIIEHVVLSTSPHALLKKYRKQLVIKKGQKVAVIAIGKAAKTMGKAILDLLPHKPTYVIYADSGHPFPTPTGITKTKRIMKVAKSLNKNDLAIVLISGGGSAMFVQPRDGITLEDTIETTRILLMCGATINEINCVRKHISQVKGGGLARLLHPATVKAFVISDVVGNDLSTIASGPLSADPTTFADALKVITKYKAPVPNTVRKYIENNAEDADDETLKKEDTILKNISITIIADHYTALRAAQYKAKKIARRTKHTVIVNQQMLTGEAREIGRKFIKQLSIKSIVLACGETTVTCSKNPGFGGRNQEFALSTLTRLKENQTIASFGTDGVDGICPTKVAGALVDINVLQQAKYLNLDIEKFLKNNDSYSFFKKVGGMLITGSTGNNIGDLVIAVTD